MLSSDLAGIPEAWVQSSRSLRDGPSMNSSTSNALSQQLQHALRGEIRPTSPPAGAAGYNHPPPPDGNDVMMMVADLVMGSDGPALILFVLSIRTPPAQENQDPMFTGINALIAQINETFMGPVPQCPHKPRVVDLLEWARVVVEHGHFGSDPTVATAALDGACQMVELLTDGTVGDDEIIRQFQIVDERVRDAIYSDRVMRDFADDVFATYSNPEHRRAVFC